MVSISLLSQAYGPGFSFQQTKKIVSLVSRYIEDVAVDDEH